MWAQESPQVGLGSSIGFLEEVPSDLSFEESIVVPRRGGKEDFRERGEHVQISTGAGNDEIEPKLCSP